MRREAPEPEQLLEQAFQAFLVAHAWERFPPRQVELVREPFFAGARETLRLLFEGTETEDVDEHARKAGRTLEQLRSEILAFATRMVARHMANLHLQQQPPS